MLDRREIYSMVIFSKFNQLTANERKAHLQYIKDFIYDDVVYESQLVNKKRQNPALRFLWQLKNLQCMESKDGTLQTVGKFSDHTRPIFIIFCDHFQFVPREYQGGEWMNFLCGLGLCQKVIR